jgi:hypothetical protein
MQSPLPHAADINFGALADMRNEVELRVHTLAFCAALQPVLMLPSVYFMTSAMKRANQGSLRSGFGNLNLGSCVKVVLSCFEQWV